ncbi:uncharacterized protein geko [Tribolium castaneum]|uniref:uncharacterized protein geko n=1 Tax=Tribolium castaneum TaxID=7070 RepID=UPI00017589B5|nr:PREDICTED: uncharacterized protein LOC100141613 [Tribolium castaneum]XP_015840390.1 PREDICTED: uncharacterized protein LOC100141613 [Tribolium castaneum]|eukprot:XP_001808377.1 PREDICTED: uncharacterized protein LOC100141613 [Tribolium castaneum]
MVTAGKIVIRIVFVVCVVLVLITDYSGLIHKLIGGNRTDEAGKVPPRPKNPGYGDPKTDIDIDADIEDDSIKHLGTTSLKSELLQTIKNACLPKLICELNATPQKDKLTESEKSLLTLLRDTSISTTAELTSKYHFAAHMGQLIAGVEGNGCHNFYPTCPFPGLQVLQMMKKVRMR